MAFGIRVAWSQLVMPVGFAIMVLRFAWRGGRRRALRVGRCAARALAAAAAAFLLGAGHPGAGAGRALS